MLHLKSCASPFVQMFSIHAFVRSGPNTKQNSLVFSLMARRRTVDYKKVLRAVLRTLPSTRVEKVVVDFEPAIWMAIQTILPDVHIQGCVFHWSQAVNRKGSEIGLQAAYRHETAVHDYLRQLIALPFLPAADIPATFRLLRRLAKCQLLDQLCSYVESTWLKHSIWGPENWSVFGQVVRTNNDLEGWHRRLNLKAGDSKLPMYVLVRILAKEASPLPLQVQMVSEGKLQRNFRQETKTVQSTLFSLWDQWDNDEVNTSQFLKLVGKCYGY